MFNYLLSNTCYQYEKSFMHWQVTVLLSELSLDIILFVVGKLNLAGPYTVKSSLVLANCCKVFFLT